MHRRTLLVTLASIGCASGPAAPRSTPLPNAGIPTDNPDQGIEGRSVTATFTCTGSPCPWGATLTTHAIAWPVAAESVHRLGYTVSPWIYLPGSSANGMAIALKTGTATAYAGPLDLEHHRSLATLDPWHPYVVAGLEPGDVLSVQGPSAFTYLLRGPGEAPPNGPAKPSGSGEVHQAIAARWRCDVPECKGADWVAAVVSWPAWAAYQNNRRSGDKSRSVFSSSGDPLYPYMGAWADGCEVTALSGLVLIIEWQRGTDKWRETRLQPGQKHVIRLTPPENGAVIETEDNGPVFSVSLEHCTPKPVPR